MAILDGSGSFIAAICGPLHVLGAEFFCPMAFWPCYSAHSYNPGQAIAILMRTCYNIDNMKHY